MKILLGTKSPVVLLAGVVSVLVLGGCSGGDDEDRERVDAVEAHAQDAVDGVLHDIAAAVRMDFAGGNHSYSLCGESYAPRGVVHRTVISFDPSPLAEEEAVDEAARVLEAAGWTVVRPDNPAIVEGKQDANTVRLQFGGAAADVQVTSDCVETSGDVARDYAEVRAVDIDWR